MKIKLHTNKADLEWLWAIGDIIGAEEGDGDHDDKSGDDDAPNDSEDPDDPSKESQEHDDADDPKVKGLKSALATERANNKRIARELRQAQKAKDERELAEKSEVEQATAKATQAEEKATKLAQGLLKRDIDSAIEKAARDAGFIDIDDALSGVDRSKITWEQDDDDPSDIEIDFATVKAEVKGLASRKKHLIRSGTEDGQPTGSTFGGGGKRKKGKLDDDALKERYPSLR